MALDGAGYLLAVSSVDAGQTALDLPAAGHLRGGRHPHDHRRPRPARHHRPGGRADLRRRRAPGHRHRGRPDARHARAEHRRPRGGQGTRRHHPRRRPVTRRGAAPWRTPSTSCRTRSGAPPRRSTAPARACARTEAKLERNLAQQTAVARLGRLALEGEDLRSLLQETVEMGRTVLDAELSATIDASPDGRGARSGRERDRGPARARRPTGRPFGAMRVLRPTRLRARRDRVPGGHRERAGRRHRASPLRGGGPAPGAARSADRPAEPHAVHGPSLAGAQPQRPRAGPRWPCSSSTSTASSSSTTRSDTAPATSCCACWPGGSARRCAPVTRSRASAATSSA